MRKYIFFFLLMDFFVTGALAQTGKNDVKAETRLDTIDPHQDISRLEFYPHEGRWIFSTVLDFTAYDYSSNSNGGHSKTTYTDQVLSASYGLWGTWYMGFSETIVFETLTDSVTGAGVNNVTSSTGMSDPLFSISNRVSDYFNTSIAYVPGLIAKQNANQTQKGNAASAGGSLSWTNTIIYSQPRNEMNAQLVLMENFGGDQSGGAPANTSTQDSYSEVSLMFNDRYHLKRNFFIEGSLDLTMPYTTTAKGGALTVSKTEIDGVLKPIVEMGYHPNSNLLFVASFASANSSRTDTLAKTDTVTHNSNNSYALGVYAQF